MKEIKHPSTIPQFSIFFITHFMISFLFMHFEINFNELRLEIKV